MDDSPSDKMSHSDSLVPRGKHGENVIKKMIGAKSLSMLAPICAPGANVMDFNVHMVIKEFKKPAFCEAAMSTTNLPLVEADRSVMHADHKVDSYRFLKGLSRRMIKNWISLEKPRDIPWTPFTNHSANAP